jgi:hypothetical protein
MTPVFPPEINHEDLFSDPGIKTPSLTPDGKIFQGSKIGGPIRDFLSIGF